MSAPLRKRPPPSVPDGQLAKRNRPTQPDPASTARSFCNWVRLVQVGLHKKSEQQENLAVLDLSCGKGGDVYKWANAGAETYVGVDSSPALVTEARTRRGDVKSESGGKFAAHFICADCLSKDFSDALLNDGINVMFNIIVCNYGALERACQSEEKLKIFLDNIKENLQPNGVFLGMTMDANVLVRKLRAHVGEMTFGNNLYSISFHGTSKAVPKSEPFGHRYSLKLGSAAVEEHSLVVMPAVEKLATEYGRLQRVYALNLHDFFNSNLQAHRATVGRAKLPSPLTADDWDTLYLYLVFAFTHSS